MPLAPKSRLGPYEILSAVGSGGMGDVYRAVDTRLNRTVAIKVLPTHLADDPEARARFDREARAISSLNHPRICALYDVGHQDASPDLPQPVDYLVLEFVEGETLAARLARGPLPTSVALTIAIEICDALERAHRQDLTHRDLKPANVMITPAGVKLLDFGLAKQRSAILADEATAAVTARGAIVGTLSYMAPEQIEGREADARSDIWALGCVLYEMIGGAKAFDGASGASVIAAILERVPADLPSRTIVPPRLRDVIRTCLEKNPDDRWQSVRDLRRELTWLRDAPAAGAPPAAALPARSRLVWPLAAALILLAAIPAIWFARGTARAATPAGPPVIVLMDSTHPERIYDEATRNAGGTNADDLTDLLRDLPVVLLKENTNMTWHREYEVLQEHPAMIVAHRSCFYDATVLGDASRQMPFINLSWDKFETFAGLVGVGNPQTKILAYSRGSWDSEDARAKWVSSMEQRFPPLRSRIDAMRVPLDRATFRDPVTGAEIRKKIIAALHLQS